MKTLVEHAHKDFAAASKSPNLLEVEASASSAQTPPPAFEAFLEGLAEDFPPLARDVLEACAGTWGVGKRVGFMGNVNA